MTAEPFQALTCSNDLPKSSSVARSVALRQKGPLATSTLEVKTALRRELRQQHWDEITMEERKLGKRKIRS